MEKFSVAMSVYKNDNAEYFKRSLQSITDEQTLKPNEIVLIENGPVSQSIDAVAKEFSNKYDFIKVIKKPVNEGLGAALKLATENCLYPYIARMDSDDVSLPDRFMKQMTFMTEHPEVDFLGGDITEFSGNEDNIVSIRSLPRLDADIKKFMKKRCGLNHPTVMMKKSALFAAGGYGDPFNKEDWCLWVRAMKNGAVFENLDSVLVNFRADNVFQRRGGYAYYKSEKGLYKYMLKNRIIGFPRYVLNCTERFMIHVVFPNKLRALIYKKFARRNADGVRNK